MYGLNVDPNNPAGNPDPGELKALGVELVRFSYIDESTTLTPDPARIDFYRPKLKAYSDVGIKSLIIVAYESVGYKPAYDAPDSEWGQYINLFATRAGHLAAYFDALSPAYQIWNEPDLAPQPGYEPSLRESVYGSILRRTRETIKAFSSGALVVGAGLASGLPDYWARVVESQRQPDGKVPALLDINAMHPYGQQPEPDWPAPGWGFGYVGNLIEGYRAKFAGPWWITESGVKDVSDEMQAEYLRRMYRTIKSRPDWKVNELIWFCWSDGMVSPYGLVRADSNRKPAYAAYQEVTRGH